VCLHILVVLGLFFFMKLKVTFIRVDPSTRPRKFDVMLSFLKLKLDDGRGRGAPPPWTPLKILNQGFCLDETCLP